MEILTQHRANPKRRPPMPDKGKSGYLAKIAGAIIGGLVGCLAGVILSGKCGLQDVGGSAEKWTSPRFCHFGGGAATATLAGVQARAVAGPTDAASILTPKPPHHAHQRPPRLRRSARKAFSVSHTRQRRATDAV